MSSPRSVEQKNINTGGGDNVAGNKIENKFSYGSSSASDGVLQELYASLAREMKNNSSCATIVSILEEFVATKADEVVGLKSKLIAGGMEIHIEYAEEAKERYVSNLTKYQFYESGQLIHGVLLNKAQSRFQGAVAPKLASLTPSSKLELAQQAVLEPLRLALGSNPLWLLDKELDGLLFFLTGKCKIKWT